MKTELKTQTRTSIFSRPFQPRLTPEETFILKNLSKLKTDMDCLHNLMDNVTEPLLLESYIYELKATNLKYSFYLKLCKEKGLTNEMT